MDARYQWRDKGLLRDLYLDEELSQREIAERLGCDKKTVGNWLDKHGIERREGLDNSREDRPYADESTLRRLHIEEELTLTQIADRFECAVSTVSRYCNEFGIEPREYVRGPDPKHEKLTDAEWLREQHHDERLACHEIGERLGVSPDTVLRWLHKHGIETVRRHTLHPVLDDPERLRKLHHGEELTTNRIGEQLGVHRTVVSYHLRKHGIRVRHITRSGENHPSWKGGYDTYYGPNWQEQRENALRRDNYQCAQCGKTNEEHKAEYGRALTCHHIQPIRTFKRQYDAPEWWERANVLENLVTLCDPHHHKWEGIPLRPIRVR